jgi:ubiquinone/menaquinone biosynthesis C-methylase UbiE
MPVERGGSHYQRTVDAFFQKRSTYWRDVYSANTLSASIYRDRRTTVLSMVDKLRLPARSRILEIGCGAGPMTVPLAKRGYRVNAVDTVEGMLELARYAVNEAGLSANVEMSSADICQLEFPSQHFALVTVVGVFAWLENPERAIMETVRVTKPGGYIILTATNSWSLNQILDPLCFPALRPMRWQIAEMLEKMNIWGRSKPRQHRYSIKDIDALIRHAGLHKLEGKTLGFGPFTIFKRNLLPNSVGVKVHQKLQSLADSQFPVIRSAGVVYVVVAQRT